MEEAITIEQLYKITGALVKKGHGKKKILLSSDDEGNSYHEMFFAISEVENCVSEEYQLPYGVTMEVAKKEYVILG